MRAKKILFVVALLVSSVAAVVGPAFAGSIGHFEYGDIYWAKNVTKNGSFVDPASATCGDTVQFRVQLHNPGPDPLNNVNVKATLPSGKATSHTSQVTVFAANANPATTADTATVNLDKSAQLEYVTGSTELLSDTGARLQTLGETIFTSAGVNIGTVGVSTQQKRFVQFSATVKCDETPPETHPNYDVVKTVDKTTARPGDTLNYTITVRNTGDVALTNVVVKDTLPAKLTDVSAVVATPSDGVTGDLFSADGLRIARIPLKGTVTLTFSAKVVGESQLECGDNRLTNTVWSSTTEVPNEPNTSNNTATTDVNRECTPPVTPPTNPGGGTTEYIPATGPAEAALFSIVGSGALTYAGYTWANSRKALRKVLKR